MVPVTAFLKGVHCSQHLEIGFCLCLCVSYLSQVRWCRPREKEFRENVKVCQTTGRAEGWPQTEGTQSPQTHP